MKQVLIVIGGAVVLVSMVLAHPRNQTAVPRASDALVDVRRAIDKGNAQWSEGWAKGDASMHIQCRSNLSDASLFRGAAQR